MTKLKLTMTAVCVLAMAGCAGDREPGTVRNGPQVENPHADAPGGKMPDNGGAGTVIIDDSAAG